MKKMKKTLLTIVLTTLTLLSFAQIKCDFGLSYSSNELLTIKLGLITADNAYFGIYHGTELNESEYFQDIQDIDKYNIHYGISFGYKNKLLLININAGLINSYSYENYSDNDGYNISDYNIIYNFVPEIGVDVAYYIKERFKVSIGTSVTNGLGLGLSFSQPYRLGIGIIS